MKWFKKNNKPKVWTFYERLKYFILPFATMLYYGIRMYACAVISTRFDFKYVHYFMNNYKDIQDLNPKFEALQLLAYIEGDAVLDPPVEFRSKLVKRIAALKKKGSIIDKDESFHSVMLRIMLDFFDIETTKQLPAHLKSPQHLYALYKYGVRMIIEPELYTSHEHLNAMILGDRKPEAPLDARILPVECVDFLLNHSMRLDAWLEFGTLSLDQQVLYLKNTPPSSNNEHYALPAIKLGLTKHTVAFLPRLNPEYCPCHKEIISFCNEQKIKFQLATTDEEINIIQSLLTRGLDHDLVHEEEVGLSKLNYFRVTHLNIHALKKTASERTWSQFLRLTPLSEEDWLDLEQLVLSDPVKIRLVPIKGQSAGMVQAYFRSKKARHNEFMLDHQPYRDMIPYLVSERPKLAGKIIRNHFDKKVEEAFAAEIKKLEKLPAFVTKRSLVKNLKHAWLKDCPYSKEHLRRADIEQVLACTTNGDALRFINKHIASREGDRHVDLYPEAIREDILLEDLGL
jgi:hypothetical protein